MELSEILQAVLTIALIVLVGIFLVIGFYVVTILAIAKRVLTSIAIITFNLRHLRTFAKLGTTGTILKILNSLRKGGEKYGKRGYAS